MDFGRDNKHVKRNAIVNKTVAKKKKGKKQGSKKHIVDQALDV